jgi:hypothetical protein
MRWPQGHTLIIVAQRVNHKYLAKVQFIERDCDPVNLGEHTNVWPAITGWFAPLVHHYEQEIGEYAVQSIEYRRLGTKKLRTNE